MTIEKEKVKTVRTPEDQKKYEKEQRRIEESSLFDFWSGTVDVGFSMTSGNADTRTFTAGAKGVRETPHNKFTAYANALHITDTANRTRKITAQSVWTGARYDSDLNPRYFAFGSGDFEYNKPQKLNLRAVLGGGIGHHAYRKENFNLDLTGGLTNNYENFSNGIRRNSAEVLLGEELKFKMGSRAAYRTRRFLPEYFTRRRFSRVVRFFIADRYKQLARLARYRRQSLQQSSGRSDREKRFSAFDGIQIRFR